MEECKMMKLITETGDIAQISEELVNEMQDRIRSLESRLKDRTKEIFTLDNENKKLNKEIHKIHELFKKELNNTINYYTKDRQQVLDDCQRKIDNFEEAAHFHKNRYEELLKEKGNKKHRLEVKLMNRDELLVIEGNDNINMPDIIEQYFNQEKEFICFGYIGVRRSEIEWYAITEVVENNG